MSTIATVALVRRDDGAHLFRRVPPRSVLHLSFAIASEYLSAGDLSRFEAVCYEAATITVKERRRRRRVEQETWRCNSAKFHLRRLEAAERREKLALYVRAALDRQLGAAICAKDCVRAAILIRFGATVPVPFPSHVDDDEADTRLNFAVLVHRILTNASDDRCMKMAHVMVLLGAGTDVLAPLRATVGDRRLTAFDQIMDFGVERRPAASLRLLQMMAAAGFRIPRSSLPYWTAFMDSFAADGGGARIVKAAIVRMAVAHGWFDLADESVMGDGAWNRFPHSILGAIPSSYLLHELMEAATPYIAAWTPTRTSQLNSRLRQHGQSPATVLDYFQRFGHTRRLMRSLLLRHAPMRRLLLCQWPQLLLHVYECQDHTTIRLLYGLEPELVGAACIDGSGNTLLHYMARVPNRIAPRCVQMFEGEALRVRNSAGQTPEGVAARLGHVLPWKKCPIELSCLSLMCIQEDD